MKRVRPLYSLLSQVKYLLSNFLVTAGDGPFLDLAPYPQVIFTAPEEITSEHIWPVSHTLSSLDSGVSAQLPQVYQAQPAPDDASASTTSILNLQAPVNYSETYHLDP
jgi:hypothetical protein